LYDIDELLQCHDHDDPPNGSLFNKQPRKEKVIPMSDQSFEDLVAAAQRRHANVQKAAAASVTERERRFGELTRHSEMMQFILRAFRWLNDNSVRARDAATRRFFQNPYKGDSYLDVTATSADGQWMLRFGTGATQDFRVEVFTTDGTSDDLPSRSYYMPITQGCNPDLKHSSGDIDEFFAALTYFTPIDCVESIAKLIRDNNLSPFRG
jgi:hypothetical protein